MSFQVGARVETASTGKGTVAFYGSTQFADGEWVGIILDEPKGKNNGTVKDVEYFQCEPNYGLFVRPNQLKLEGQRKQSGMRAPSSLSSRPTSKRPSPGQSPGLSPAVSNEQIAARQQFINSRAKSKISDPNESRLVREASNVSISSTRSIVPPKSRKSIAPEAASRRASLAPKKISNAGTKTENKTETPNESPKSEDNTQMTSSGTELPKESVLSKAKKIDDTGSSSMSPSEKTAAAVPKTITDNTTELEYLRLQVKELTEKLEATRAKRKDDHAKLLEFERISIEYRTLQEVKSRLNDRVVELERQLLDERKSAEEYKAQHEMNKEYQEMIEMMTIERELAEEKAEVLQQQVNELTEKLESVEAEMEILKEEMSMTGDDIPVGNSVQLKTIEQQNEKLKAALIKLRDLSGQATAEKQKAVDEAEKLRNENSELISVAEALKRQTELAESKIAGFQEQIDAAMGAEAMVTQLSNKNFDMEEKIAKLEESIELLEEDLDLDQQLMEVHKQQEADLMKEIEELNIRIHDLNGRIRDEQNHAHELSSTILKFREKMAGLNSQIQDQKDLILNLEEELSGHKNEDFDRATIVSQLQVTANKNFAEIVAHEVNSIELEFVRKQAEYLKAFLPDNFSKIGGDNESIKMIIMFPRMSAKAKLFAKLSSSCYPSVSGGMRKEHVTKSHKAEQWAHVARVAYIANSLVAVMGQFESATSETSVELLIKLTEMYGEMSTHERCVDQYLELLKTGRFDENTSLENFEKPVLYFQNVFSVHIGGDGFNTCQWVLDILAVLSSGMSACKTNLQRISFVLQENVTSGELIELLEYLNNEIVACEGVVFKSSKLVPNEKKVILKLESEFSEEVLNASAKIDRLFSTLRETANIGSMQIGGISETDGLDEQRVKEIIHGVVVKSHGWIAVENSYEPLRKNVLALRNSLEKAFSVLESGKMEKPVSEKKNFPPLLDRAHHRKQAASEAEGLRWQMEKKDNEMLELRRQMKERIEDLANYKIRLEMSESRLNSTDKMEGEKVNHLEEKINQLMADHKRKQIEFDESMDALKREMKEIECENLELKQRATKMTKDNMLKNMQSMETMITRGATEDQTVARGEVAFLEHRINRLMEARKRAELEVMRLKTDLAQIGGSKISAIPGLISGPITLETQSRQDHLMKLFDKLDDEYMKLERQKNKYIAYFPKNHNISEEKMKREIDKFEKERELYFDKLISLNRQRNRVWEDCWGEKYPLSHEVIVCKDPTPEEVQLVCSRWGIEL